MVNCTASLAVTRKFLIFYTNLTIDRPHKYVLARDATEAWAADTNLIRCKNAAYLFKQYGRQTIPLLLNQDPDKLGIFDVGHLFSNAKNINMPMKSRCSKEFVNICFVFAQYLMF